LGVVLEVSIQRNAAKGYVVEDTKITLVAGQAVATGVTSIAIIGAKLAGST